MSQRKHTTAVRLYDKDQKNAQAIQDVFGLDTLSAAVRFALHTTQKTQEVTHGPH